MIVYLRDGSAQAIVRGATFEIEVADQTFHLTQSQYTDTEPSSPSADPQMLGAVIRIRNYPKKQVMALPVEWWNKTARSPDCVASIVIASPLPYHHFMVAAVG